MLNTIFFTDQRQSKSHTTVIGGYGNVDILPPLIPGPSFWPALSTVKRDLKLFHTNKIIFKSGIVSEIHTYDGKSKVITKNEIFDGQTGRPIITSVNNEFEDLIYNYTHPAHWEYDRMGGAYKNINMEFEARITDTYGSSGLAGQYILETSEDIIDQLVSGDVILGYYEDTDPSHGLENWFTATYLHQYDADHGVIYVEKANSASVNSNTLFASGEKCTFKVIRSGRRNHVFTDAGAIVSKKMPINMDGYDAGRVSVNLPVTETVAGDPTSYTVKLVYLDRILNATAMTFKDEWELYSDEQYNENPYATGEAGVWRPNKSYVYIGQRNAGANPAHPLIPTDIRNNGEMDAVYFFDWQIENFEKHVPEWNWTNEITKYSENAYELEVVDRLGIKSAVLYAHNGSLVVGVGSNGRYSEIGVEDFERYPAGGDVLIGEMDFDDNLGFYNDLPSGFSGFYSKSVNRSYKIVGGKSLSNGEFKVEVEGTDPFFSGDIVQLTLKTNEFTPGVQSDTYIFAADVLSTSTSGSNTVLTVKSRHQYVNSSYISLLEVGAYLTGRLQIEKTKNSVPSTYTDNIEFVEGKAHTGNQSMKFSNSFNFPQGNLDLIKDKTYYFSAWVSRDDVRKMDFEGIDLDVRQWEVSSWVTISNPLTLTKGKIVEGWQKIEFEFTPTVENSHIAIYMKSGIDQVQVDAYIDDVRISPKTGGIRTYVYDPTNFRLKAMLDENNYATLYSYDEEGNLHLVKRETERGIQTISENRSHTVAQ